LKFDVNELKNKVALSFTRRNSFYLVSIGRIEL